LEIVLTLTQDRYTVCVVHGLRQKYHRIRNHFGRTRWYS
jgi:hypothetical protein